MRTSKRRWLCAQCQHITEPIELANPTCAAFPLGIPMEIQMGQFRHTEPFPDDNGIRFKPTLAEKEVAE